METTNIYTLTDPRTKEVRYVGKANNLTQRYKAHLNRARKHQTHKKNWLEQLKREGLRPIIEVVDIVPVGDWRYWERYWIAQMRQWGFNLVNHTDGGDGCTFGNQTSFKKGQGGKKVVAYNSDYEKVYEFDSTRQASREIGVTSVWHACVGKGKTVKGLAWFYEKDVRELSGVGLSNLIDIKFLTDRKGNSGSFKKGEKGFRSKKVLMYDLDWNFIREFESAKSAGNYVGTTGGAIQFACTNSKSNKCKNYKFKYK